MTVAVLDANVLVAGFTSPTRDAAPAALIDAWQAGGFILVTSEHLLEEVIRAFTKPYFRRHMRDAPQVSDTVFRRGEVATNQPGCI